MQFKYELSKNWVDKIKNFEEFSNGGMQVSIKANDGTVHKRILISNSMWVVAMRGYRDLPFSLEEISDIFQTEDDKNPAERSGWDYWDKWK